MSHNTTDTNNLISHVYQVDLPGGRAVSYNPPRLEYSSAVADLRQVSDTALFAGAEAYSANALWIGKNLLAGNDSPILDATFFRLMFRYNIPNERSRNLFIIWVDPANPPEEVVCKFFDEDENFMSGIIPINYGLNILNMAMYIPSAFLHDDYPVAGWVDIETSNIGFDANLSWIGYSWQMGSGKKSKGKGKPFLYPGRAWWDVIQPADRETDDVPSTP